MTTEFRFNDDNFIREVKESPAFTNFIDAFRLNPRWSRIVGGEIQYKIDSHIWTDFGGLVQWFIMQNFQPSTVAGINPTVIIPDEKIIGKDIRQVVTNSKGDASVLTLSLPITYWVDEVPGSKRESDLKNALNTAAQEWQNALKYPQSKTLFALGKTKKDSNAIVSIKPNKTGNAESFRPGKYIFGGPPNTFAIDETFYNNNIGKIDFHGVLLHELGHMLGFVHEVPLLKILLPLIVAKGIFLGYRLTPYDPTSIMRPDNTNTTTKPSTKINQLSKSDKDGLNAVYS